MEAWVIGLVAALTACALLSLALLRSLRREKKAENAYEKRLAKLEAEVRSQREAIAKAESALALPMQSDLLIAIETLGQARGKGLWPTLAKIGVQLLGAYWRKGRSQRATAVRSKD